MSTNRQIITVTTNHFKIKQLPSETFYQYQVTITAQNAQDDDPRSNDIGRKRATELVLQLQTQEVEIFTPRAIYDGGALMFSTNENIGGRSYPISIKRGARTLTFHITISRVSAIRADDIKQLVTRGQHSQGNLAPALNLLQLMVRSAPNIKHGYYPLKRNAFYSGDARKQRETDLGGGLVLWKGYFQSVRPALGGLMINVDVSNAAVYQEGELLTLAVEYVLGNRGGQLRDMQSRLRDRVQWDRLSRHIKGLLIRPKHMKWPNGRKITEIIPKAGLYEFDDGNGVRWTIKDYFQRKYNKTIQYPEVFGVRIGKTAIFPAELCDVLPGQLYRKRLQPDQQQKFIKQSTTLPSERLKFIMGAQEVFDYDNSDFMSPMTVSKTPEQLRGEVLPDPNMEFGRGNSKTITFGKWNVTQSQYKMAKEIKYMAAITFVPNSREQVIRFVQGLHRTLAARGTAISYPMDETVIVAGNPQDIDGAFWELFRQMGAGRHPRAPRDLTILMVILPQSAAAIKQRVKYLSNTYSGHATQCVRDGKYNRGNDQYLNNVALKINAKIGGINSTVNSPAMSMLRNTMTIGCDVSHPGPGASEPSFASIVASLDDRASVYSSFVSIQRPRDEMIEKMGEMFQSALEDYKGFSTHMQKSQDPLKNVIVFRDGVSEGEYHQVQGEIQQIQAELQQYSMERKVPVPTLTFIVVTKRHHVRFFPHEREASNPQYKNNCPPGLVIDHEIVQADLPNFYLQSHAGLQGTSCPSHYIVIQNGGPWNIKQLQELSYALCYCYASATRSVSIPTPVYYADRVCSSAKWLFDNKRPELDLHSDAGTADSGRPVVDLDMWNSQFKQAKTNKRLYFL